MAATLKALQDSAVGLAVEQAVLRRNLSDSFLNLGRRNQNLLARQLDFITELESRETDHDVLASPYRLDHLATRMRRNAESLLVLAGVEPPREWGAPVPLVDVVRAAVGEVEAYQRVLLQRIEPAMIAGSTATDLAHLLAELVENGLAFSPPGLPVEVRGWPASWLPPWHPHHAGLRRSAGHRRHRRPPWPSDRRLGRSAYSTPVHRGPLSSSVPGYGL